MATQPLKFLHCQARTHIGKHSKEFILYIREQGIVLHF